MSCSCGRGRGGGGGGGGGGGVVYPHTIAKTSGHIIFIDLNLTRSIGSAQHQKRKKEMTILCMCSYITRTLYFHSPSARDNTDTTHEISRHISR